MIEVGPPTVANRAPTASASARASSLSPSGATIASSSSAAAAGTGSPPEVLRQSDSSTVRRRDALDRSSWAAAARSVRGTSVTPKPRDAAGPRRVPPGRAGPPEGPPRWRRERTPRPSRRPARAGAYRRCSQGRGRQPGAVHRAGPVDQQTHRGLRSFPCGGDQCGRVGRPSAAPSRHQFVERGIQIDVALRTIQRSARQLPHRAVARQPLTSEVDHDATGQMPGEAAQTLVGRGVHVSQERQRLVGIDREQLVERRLVELSQLRGDLGEAPAPGEAPCETPCVGRPRPPRPSASSPSSTWSGPAGRPPPRWRVQAFPERPRCSPERRPADSSPPAVSSRPSAAPSGSAAAGKCRSQSLGHDLLRGAPTPLTHA